MSRGMAGMVLFIASEVMLFGGLFAGYFYVRNQAAVWPPEGVHQLAAGLGGILTLLLIMSRIVGHAGVVGLKSGNRTLFLVGVGLAIVMGTIFIGGQAYEWFSLMDEGLNAGSTTYGSTFYIMTGFHGAHVLGGVIGVVSGITFAKGITFLIGMPSAVPLWAVGAGVGVAASVGIFFGVYPAKKAAMLDPIAALRFEN
jgi:cytochrome c oxidase subunit 3